MYNIKTLKKNLQIITFKFKFHIDLMICDSGRYVLSWL